MVVFQLGKGLPLDSNSGGSFGGVNDIIQNAPGSSVQDYGNSPSFNFTDTDFQTGSFAQKLQEAPEDEGGIWQSFKNFGTGLWEIAKGGANWLERQVQNESDERGIANWDEYQKYSKELDNAFTPESRRQELIKQMKENNILMQDYEDQQNKLRTEAQMQASVLGKKFEYTSAMENSIAKYFLDSAAPELQNLKGQMNEANQVVEHASTLASEIMESAQAIEGLSISREEKDKMIQEYINTRILTSKDFLKEYAKNIRVYSPDEAYERTMDNKNFRAIGQKIEDLEWDMQTSEATRFFREPGLVSAYTSIMNTLGIGTEFVGDVADFILPGSRREEQGFSELYSNQATGNFSSFFREINEGADNISEFAVGLLGGSALLKIPKYLAKTNAVVRMTQGLEAVAGNKFARGFGAFATEMTEDMLKYDMAFQSFMDRPMSEKDFKENLIYNVGFNSLIGLGTGALFSKEKELMMGIKNKINTNNFVSPETYREIEEVSKNGIQDTRYLDFYILNDAARIERGDTQGMIEIAAMDKVYANDLNKYKAQTTQLLERGTSDSMTGLDKMVYRYATAVPILTGVTPTELRQTMSVMDTLVNDSKNSGYLQGKVNLANIKSWIEAVPETRTGIITNAMKDKAEILLQNSSDAAALTNFTKYMVQGDLLHAMDTLAKVSDDARPGVITAANKIFKELPDTLMSSPEFLKSIEIGDNVFGYIYKGMVDGKPTFTDVFHGMDITPKEIRQGARSAIWSNTVANVQSIGNKTFSDDIAKKLENVGFRMQANKIHPEDHDLFIEKMTSLNFNELLPQDGALLKALFDEETKTYTTAMIEKLNTTLGVETDILEKFFKTNFNTNKLFEYTPTRKVKIRVAQQTGLVQNAMNRIAFGQIEDAMEILRRVMVIHDVEGMVQGVKNGNYTRLKEYINDGTVAKFLNLTEVEMNSILSGLRSVIGTLDPAQSKHMQEYLGVFTSIFNEVNTINRVKTAPMSGSWMKNIFVNLLEKLGKSGQYTQEALASHISKC